MRDDITSIPISEVFEPKDGCPLCRMREMLTERIAVYITGAAMMEPDIRQETNRLGFCNTHYRRLLKQQKRLPLALMMESHLAQVQKTAFQKGLGGKVKKPKEKHTDTCFMCDNINRNMGHLVSNVVRLWEKEDDFRKLYAQQPFFCLPHCRELTEAAWELPKKLQGAFVQVTAERTEQYLQELSGDVSHFCKMFDYRNSGANKDWGNSKDAIERAIYFLTGEEAE